MFGFLGLAGYFAALLSFFVHEFFGHGVVALLLGGRFDDFYLNPLGGSANSSAPGGLNTVVVGAGPVVTFAIGLGAYWLARRGARATVFGLTTAVVLWCVANEAILDTLAYMALQPALLGTLGGVESGDWLLISRRWAVSPWLFLAVGLAVAVPLGGLLMDDAHRLFCAVMKKPDGFRPLTSYWMMQVPGALLVLLYLAIFAPWQSGRVSMALGGVFGAPLLGTLGVLWRRLAGSAVGGAGLLGRGASTGLASRHVAVWTGVILLVAATTGWVFGPTEELRRGVAVGEPEPDQYIGVAQSLQLDIHLSDDGAAGMAVASFARPGHGSAFRRRLTEALGSRGPSRAGAREISAFIAEWNLDGASVQSVADPEQQGGAWVWEAALAGVSDSVMIRLWPLTWVKESHVATVRLTGVTLETERMADSNLDVFPNGEIRWTRPEGMAAVDSFLVRVR